MRKYLVIFLLILIAAFAFLTGLYMHRINVAERNRREAIGNQDPSYDIDLSTVAVSVREEKIAPGSSLIKRELYTVCDILRTQTEDMPEEFINLTEVEFAEKHPEWEIQRFTANEVVIQRNIEDFCGEHYKIRELDGRLAIFQLDKQGNEIGLIRITDVWTNFLSEIDLQEIESGRIIHTRAELMKALEDFDA